MVTIIQHVQPSTTHDHGVLHPHTIQDRDYTAHQQVGQLFENNIKILITRGFFR